MYAVKDNRTTYLDRLIELGSDVCARNNVSVSCFQLHVINHHQRHNEEEEKNQM